MISIYNRTVFLRLLLIFITVPLLELYIIIEVSSRFGLLETIVALLLISFAGAALAKREGYSAIARIQDEIAHGRMPGDPLIEGGVILAGAVLLLTPGFLTDAAGLMMLFPPTRRAALALAKRRIRRAVSRRTVYVWTAGDDTWTATGGGSRASREEEQRRRELGD